jgi:hypothetical protein
MEEPAIQVCDRLNLCVAIGFCGIPGPKIGTWGTQHRYNIMRSETEQLRKPRLNAWAIWNAASSDEKTP